MRLSGGVEKEAVRKLTAKLAKLSEATTKEVREEIAAGALKIQADAQRSMASTKRGTPKTITRDDMTVTHAPSVPGSAPAIDTGKLVSSVTHEISPDGLSAVVGTNTVYGEHLEFGTLRMAARPWLFPAFERNRPAIFKRMARAADKALKRAGK